MNENIDVALPGTRAGLNHGKSQYENNLQGKV
jgi:hypothetical protein